MVSKRSVLFLILLLFYFSNRSYGQNYYSFGQNIIGNGFVYECENYKGVGAVRLYNSNNALTNATQTRKSGGTITYNKPFNNLPDRVVYEPRIGLSVTNIVGSALNATEKNSVGTDILGITLYINSDTGKVMEVEFIFNPARSGFVHIPPEKYYNIERQIKQNIIFNVTTEGKSLNFNVFTHAVRGRDLQ